MAEQLQQAKMVDDTKYEASCTPEELENYKLAFRRFDRDGSGAISCDEMETVLQELGQNPTPQDIKDMMNEADIDGNGTVDLKEFIDLMVRFKNNHDADADLKEAFKILDKDNSGYLDKEELKAFMKKTDCGDDITDADIDDLIRSADTNGDGVIDIDEFIAMMNS